MIMIFSPLFLNYIISSILSCGVRWWRAYIYFCPAPVVFHRHNQKPYLDGSLLVLRQKHALFSKNGWCAHACPFYNYALGTLSNVLLKPFCLWQGVSEKFQPGTHCLYNVVEKFSICFNVNDLALTPSWRLKSNSDELVTSPRRSKSNVLGVTATFTVMTAYIQNLTSKTEKLPLYQI